jgi:AcrR family transcriptional regulator
MRVVATRPTGSSPPSLLESDTARQILDAALASLARFGPKRLSMSDICAEAGLSRGTLYRYFPNKVDLLEHLGAHVERNFEISLREAVAQQPLLEDRISVVLELIVRQDELRPPAGQLLDVEPGFALAFLRREFPRFLRVVTETLAPALADCEPVQSGSVTVEQLAEMILRLGMSAHLIPSPRARELPAQVASLLRGTAPTISKTAQRSGT